jgi:hypothetical protein
MSLSVAPAVPGQDVIVNAMGSTDSSFPGGSVSMTYKPAGGSCAATPDADSGTALDINPFGQPSPGAQTLGAVGDFTAPGIGSYLVCAWLTDGDGNVDATAQAIQMVVPYQASLTVRLLGKGAQCVSSPWAGAAGGQSCDGAVDAQEPELVVGYATNAPALLSIDYRPASGTGCASSPSAEPPNAKFITQTTSDYINQLSGNEVVTVSNYYDIGVPYNAQQGDGDPGSPFTQLLGPAHGLTSGRWLLCAWISRPGQEINAAAVQFGPVAAGPVSVTFNYPTNSTSGNSSSGNGGCVVPKLKGRKLKAARKSLKKADCGVGKITRRHGRSSRRGRVVGQRPKAGTHEPAGAKVDLVVGK